MSIHSVYDLVAMGLRSDFISTKSTLVLTFRNVSRTPWDGLTHPLGVHAPQLGNPCNIEYGSEYFFECTRLLLLFVIRPNIQYGSEVCV